jgi:hypothetical protein
LETIITAMMILIFLIWITGTIPVRRVRMAQRSPQEQGFSRRPRILDYIGAGASSEDEARDFARDVVRGARSEGFHYPEAPAPDPEAVRRRREAHQHSEG